MTKLPIRAVFFAVIGTLLLWNAASFGWLGWPDFGFKTTGGVRVAVTQAVNVSHVPWCVETAQRDPDVGKLAELAGIKSDYSRITFVVNSGWAKLGGARRANRPLAELCAEELEEIEKVEAG